MPPAKGLFPARGGALQCAPFIMPARDSGPQLFRARVPGWRPKDSVVNKTDLVFLKHFAMVIGGLMLLTLVLIAGAGLIYSDHLPEPSAISAEKVAARIAPIGDVYAGATGQAAMAAAKAAAAAAAQAQVAYEGTLDGSVIYGKLCGVCHISGAGGAPQLTQALWAPRVAQGTDLLVKHAIEGYQGAAGVMPARGGNPSLNDEQVKATVQWMIDSLK